MNLTFCQDQPSPTLSGSPCEEPEEGGQRQQARCLRWHRHQRPEVLIDPCNNSPMTALQLKEIFMCELFFLRIFDVPKMTLCALRVTEKARERILKAGGSRGPG